MVDFNKNYELVDSMLLGKEKDTPISDLTIQICRSAPIMFLSMDFLGDLSLVHFDGDSLRLGRKISVFGPEIVLNQSPYFVTQRSFLMMELYTGEENEICSHIKIFKLESQT